MRLMLKLLWLLSITLPAAGQQDVVLKAMQDELARTVSQLKLEDADRPYFVSYRIDDLETLEVGATLGSLTVSQPARHRALGVEVRVGDYALDNTNYFSISIFGGGMGRFTQGIREAPLDDDYREIRRQLWLATDEQYKQAVEDLAAKRAVLANRRPSEQVPDFTREEAVKAEQALVVTRMERGALEALLRDLSGVFRDFPSLYSSSVGLQGQAQRSRYINSEGSLFTRSQARLKLTIEAEAQAEDGLPLRDSLDFFATSAGELPSKDELLAQARGLAARLERLRTAKRSERYNGPVLFEGAAAAQVLAQVFAPALVAQRTPLTDNPQFEVVFLQMVSKFSPSLADRLGGRVLPDFVHLLDDPTATEFARRKLLGGYSVDDDGVRARPTRLVDYGVLKSLLASRVPVQGVSHSTGNRRGFGAAPSNLVLKSDKTVPTSELRQELLRRARARGNEYGVIVRNPGRVSLGEALQEMFSSMASRQGPPSPSVLEAVKLYPDGREEVMRAAEISGLTPASFKDIVAVGDSPVVFDDEFMPSASALFPGRASFAGALGGLPVVSYVVPSLMFEELTLRPSTSLMPSEPSSPPPLAQK